MGKHWHTTFILGLLAVLAAFGLAAPTVLAKDSPGEDANRYTVLLLDASDTETFHYSNTSTGAREEYVSDSSIDEVKAVGKKFLEGAESTLANNSIAIVSFGDGATVESGFTNDYQALLSALDGVTPPADGDDTESNNDMTAGLKAVQELFEGVDDADATRSVILCTSGIDEDGDYDYQGHYDSNTVGSNWQNIDTEIKLYAYSNCAYEVANDIKDAGATVYVLGIHKPIEDHMPKEVEDIASFFRLFCGDLASTEQSYHVVEDPEDLEFQFGQIWSDVLGASTVRIYNNSDGYAAGAPEEDPDPSSGAEHGGHFEDMAWGPSLFETPATQVHMQSMGDKDYANYHLAMICGNLSQAAYDTTYLKQTYKLLGVDEGDYSFYSYPQETTDDPDTSLNRWNARRDGTRFAGDSDLAFSLATREMVVDGEPCDLLIVNLKGTQDFYEVIKDGTAWADKDFYGYTAWDWVWDFEEDVFAGLEDYHTLHPELGDRPLKFLITGHSLGGAGANLVAAKLNREAEGDAWYAKNTDVDDIYAYTFGAIDSINGDTTDKTPVVNGYENIINVYNLLDTFGEGGSGVGPGIKAAGRTMYGKFGVFFTYANDMDGVVKEDSPWPTHEIIGYIQAVKNGWPEEDQGRGKVRVVIACPVDVAISQGDELACAVEGEEITAESPDIPMAVEGGHKVFLLPAGTAYTADIDATDAGTMQVAVQSAEPGSDLGVAFANVALEAGKHFSGEIPANLVEGTVELFVVDANGAILEQISPDGSTGGFLTLLGSFNWVVLAQAAVLPVALIVFSVWWLATHRTRKAAIAASAPRKD